MSALPHPAPTPGHSAGSDANAPSRRMKVDVRNLDFFYGRFHAIRNVSIQIPEHQVTAFIGPSGCGKSTLLRTFNRMFEIYPEQRATGQIMVDGEDILVATRGYPRRIWTPASKPACAAPRYGAR